MSSIPPLTYNPETLTRELERHYISATETDIQEMLEELGLKTFEDLFSHIPQDIIFKNDLPIPEERTYSELQKHIFEISEKNNPCISFIGDGLHSYKVMDIVPFVSAIRGLTTSYTPYQPERSQGTLLSHWIYQSLISMLTGFEAINASMYDRATALFEAMNCARRLVKNSNTIIVLGSIYPGDMEVIQTMTKNTTFKLEIVYPASKTGITSVDSVRKKALTLGPSLTGIVFPQINHFGNVEDVDALTDLARGLAVSSIAIVDIMLLGTGGLKPPAAFGKNGADMFVSEGQHIAIAPNCGGPGLGVFGIRYNAENKTSVRSSAGRFVGQAQDKKGRPCKVLVLSTREQHIRREKATSNICSNQAFLATAAGAALLERGEEGMKKASRAGRRRAEEATLRLTNCKGVFLTYPETPFYNEFVVTLPCKSANLITRAVFAGLHIGVDVSERISYSQGEHLLISFADLQTDEHMKALYTFFDEAFGVATDKVQKGIPLPEKFLRKDTVNLPTIELEELKKYYILLGNQNVSPDSACYPLGSCTMKYNPYINDWAAGLRGFSDVHPQAPESDIQGCLEILYHIQEYFKAITGLPGVTTQPVAGAQGELVGIKIFQAYHKDKGEHNRDIVLIPRSAHGTNPATATMAGYTTKTIDGKATGIVLIEANEHGQIDMEHLKLLVASYGKRISCVMVTNPNTSGIFETNFKEMADLIHSVGGLVYMDGANMNAITGWVDLGKMGVDAVHNNLHKTWSIPHGGGGPGDAIVAVSEPLISYLPGVQIIKEGTHFKIVKTDKSLGSVHRHFGNFAHKVRCYTYLAALGKDGIKRMSALAVLSARYVHKKLSRDYENLPKGTDNVPRMHEFILTLPNELFTLIEKNGLSKSHIIPRVGKVFLDYGFHAPTIAFPEVFGLMIEPTESYSKAELDRFIDAVSEILHLIRKNPEVLSTAPHFTPIDRVDEVAANKQLRLSEELHDLPEIPQNRIQSKVLENMSISTITEKILEAHANGTE